MRVGGKWMVGCEHPSMWLEDLRSPVLENEEF